MAAKKSTRVLNLCLAFCIATAVGEPPPDQTPQTSTADPYLKCMKELGDSPQYSEIAKKLPLSDLNNFSFEMLADESVPTTEERRELAGWFDERQKCWQAGEELHRREWPPEIVQLSTEAFGAITEIGVDLHNKKITFGEANKRLQRLRDATLAKLTPIIRQYQADVAAQKAADEQRQAAAQEQAARQQAYADAQQARAEQLRQQRAALFLNYMRAMQPRPVQMPQLPPLPPTYNTTCNTIGNTTNCTTH